jgi:D-alanyl-D-alanine carboxypeptidase
MRLVMRGGFVLVLAGVTLLSATATAAATDTAQPAAAPTMTRSADRCPAVPSVPANLPPLDENRLAGAIANLPDEEATAALVRIRGSAGCWEGTNGTTHMVGRHRPVPLDARFRIGSMTKMFTATVALELVAEGKLSLDQTVQHYLPGLLPREYPPITVRHVLTYTSGLHHVEVDHKNWDWFGRHRFDSWAPGSQLDLTRPLAFPPGTKQRYTNVDYIVAGLLIQEVTGETWGDQIERRIIRPLNLSGTSVPGEDVRIPGPHVRGYEKVVRGERVRWIDITHANPSLQWSAASMMSTAQDLDRFFVRLLRGRLVPAHLLPLMLTPPDVPVFDEDDDPTNDRPAVDTVGLRRMTLPDGTVIIGKTGDRPGYNSAIGATPDLSRRLVYSVNPVSMGGKEQPPTAQRIVAAAFLKP